VYFRVAVSNVTIKFPESLFAARKARYIILNLYVMQTNSNELVTYSNDQAVTNSLLVAAKFQKEHKDVLDLIRNLKAENSAVKNLFVESSYVSCRNREYPMYLMNRDGFSLLVMGFTGKDALNFKLEFIEAFNKMEKQIKEQNSSAKILTGQYIQVTGAEGNMYMISILKAMNEFVGEEIVGNCFTEDRLTKKIEAAITLFREDHEKLRSCRIKII